MNTEKLNMLEDKLIRGFIVREYQTINPQMKISPDIEQEAIKLYQNDVFFNNRVKYVVSAIMAMVVEELR